MTAATTLQLIGGSLIAYNQHRMSDNIQGGWDVHITPIIEYTCNEAATSHKKGINASYQTIKQVSGFTHTIAPD